MFVKADKTYTYHVSLPDSLDILAQIGQRMTTNSEKDWKSSMLLFFPVVFLTGFYSYACAEDEAVITFNQIAIYLFF